MKTNRKRVGLGLLGCMLAASLAWAAGTTPGGLHFFEAGEVIQANLINENFAAIDAKAEANSQAIEVLSGLDAETVSNILNILQQFTPEQVEQLVILLTETEERVTALEEKCGEVVVDIANINSSITNIETNLDEHNTRLTSVENKTQFMSVNGTTTLFSGTNVQVDNGAGLTETTNGLGNLVVGYNEEGDFASCYGQAPLRTGSHNLIVGSNNEWTGFGSLVSGYLDRMHGSYCTMLGCGFTLDGWCRFRFRPENRGKLCKHEHDPEHEDHDD